MNLKRLLLIAILAPSAFVLGLSLLSYVPHQAGLLTHEEEHIALALAMVVGIIPFAVLMVMIFRRIEANVMVQNEALSRRTREMEALLAVGRVVEEATDLDRVLPAALQAIIDATSAEAAEVWLVDRQDASIALHHHAGAGRDAFFERTRFAQGEGYPGIVAKTNQPLLTHDLAADPRVQRSWVKADGFQTLYALPLRLTGDTKGVLIVAARDSAALTSQDEDRLLKLTADHLVIAIENARLQEEVQTLAILTERERLAREMHDGLAQVLGYVNTKAQAVKHLLQSGQTNDAIGQMEQLERAAQETYEDVREVILALGSNADSRPLLESLRDYVERFGAFSELPISFEVDGTPWSFNPGVEVQLLRIAQEALSNVRKHAHASKARVVLSFRPDSCRLVVEDNGRGFDPERLNRDRWPHLGLQSMRERAASIGGRLTIDTAPHQGTRVIVDLPGPAA